MDLVVEHAPRTFWWWLKAGILLMVGVVLTIIIIFFLYSIVRDNFPRPPSLKGIDCGKSTTGWGGEPNATAINCFIAAAKSCTPAYVLTGGSGGFSGSSDIYWIEPSGGSCRYGEYWESWTDTGGHSRSKMYCKTFGVSDLSSYEQNFYMKGNASLENMKSIELSQCS